jgi:hypothetical protein
MKTNPVDPAVSSASKSDTRASLSSAGKSLASSKSITVDTSKLDWFFDYKVPAAEAQKKKVCFGWKCPQFEHLTVPPA